MRNDLVEIKQLVRKDMDVDEYERLFNITLYTLNKEITIVNVSDFWDPNRRKKKNRQKLDVLN